MKSIEISVAGYRALVQHDRATYFVVAPRRSLRSSVAKRAMDLAFTILALPILAVLTVVIFFANMLFDPGPVFFRQVRMGKNGEPFVMWKFRTMRTSGDNLRPVDAPLEVDRITPIGRFLRRSKLDELPNILSILSGHMSLVGPRPDAYKHATHFVAGVPRYRTRLAVLPGITGLAQVRGGYADDSSSVRRKARYDSFYIKHSGMMTDVYILMLTCAVVLSGLRQK